MSGQDYYAPLRYEVKPPGPPRNLRPLLFSIIGVLALGGGCFGLATWVAARAERHAIEQQAAIERATTIPAAAVLAGTPFKWRELAVFDWEADTDNPRPQTAFGDFTGDGRADVLLISLTGNTRIITADGSAQPVSNANWTTTATYHAWDYDNDGIDDLIPEALLYQYSPKAKDFVTVRSQGG